MDSSSKHSPSEDSYVDVTEPSKAATPPFAGAPATPLSSLESNGKEKLQLSTKAENPGQMRYFTRVTDVIYGEVGTQGHLAPSLNLLPEIPPPLHPRTVSMMESRCIDVDMTKNGTTARTFHPSKPKNLPKRAQSLGKDHVKSSTLRMPSTKPARALSELPDIQSIPVTSSLATKPNPTSIQVLGKGSHYHKTPLTGDGRQTVVPIILINTSQLLASNDDVRKVPVTGFGDLHQLLPEELSSDDTDSGLDKLGTTARSTTCSEAFLAHQNPVQRSFSETTEWSSLEGDPPADRNGDNIIYENTIVAEMQKQRLAESNSSQLSEENRKDDLIILDRPQTLTPCKTNLPGKSTVVKMHHPGKLNHGIEEMNDSTDEKTDCADIPKNLECVSLPDCVVMETNIEEEYKKLQPTEVASKFITPDTSDDGSTDYEDLVIYEDLADKDDGYQDIEKARAEALELPKSIRHRAIRIVKGPERRRLKRKFKSHHFGDSEPPQVVVKDFDDAATPWNENLEPKAAARTPGSSSDEDDMHDGYMSHDKARQVLDMLLEANNVRKSVEKGSQSPQEHELRRKNLDIESSLDIVVLPPKVTEYQRDGLLQTKSQSEVAAEIRLLTASAPKEPPPLPGIQRSRARVVAQSDEVALRRKMLQKTKTFPQYDNTAAQDN